MPGIPTLVIERDDGTTRATLDGIRASKTESLIEKWTAEIVVDRQDWLDVRPNINRVTDRFRIERSDGSTFFEGRLADAPRDGDNITVRINSYEQDAIDAEPTGGRLIYNSVADSTVVQDAIDSVGTLTAGTIETGASSVSFTFANAEQAKVIRDAAEPGGMDVAYYSDRTVSFVERLGSNKSGSIMVSTTNQDIVEQLSVTDNYRDPVTHIRGLGAQSGPDQVTATAVASSYSAGEKQIWRRYVNKDVVNADRMQTIVDRMIQEYNDNPRRVTVEAGLVDVDVNLGDSIQVTLPEHDIDQSLRIMRLTEIIGTAQRYVAKLTNRRPERGGRRKAQDDLQRFNAGDQGFIDRDNVTSGWNPAGDGVPQTLVLPNWPDDIETEIAVDLFVQGRAWRSPVTATGHSHTVDVTHPSHSHDVTHPSHSHDVTHPSHSHDVTINTTSEDNNPMGTVSKFGEDGAIATKTIDTTSWTTLYAIGTTGAIGPTFVGVNATAANADFDVIYRLENVSQGTFYPDDTGVKTRLTTSSYSPLFQFSPDGINNDEFEFQMQAASTSDDVSYHSWDVSAGRHTHDISDTNISQTALGTTETSTTALGTTETSTTALGTNETETTTSVTDFGAQIIDSFGGSSYYPSDVEIRVNGSLVTTLTGDTTADWQATVDLIGELSPGQNTITATPTGSRGSLNLTLSSQLFRTGREST